MITQITLGNAALQWEQWKKPSRDQDRREEILHCIPKVQIWRSYCQEDHWKVYLWWIHFQKILWCIMIMTLVVVGYVDDLFCELWEAVQGRRCCKVKSITSPPPLCSTLEKPNKQEAIAQHKSRFLKQSWLWLIQCWKMKSCITIRWKSIPNSLHSTGWQYHPDVTTQPSPAPSSQLPITNIPVFPMRKGWKVTMLYVYSVYCSLPTVHTRVLIKMQFRAPACTGNMLPVVPTCWGRHFQSLDDR